jgi:pimeloyl-ACP methyl ester carboxylesterase
MLAVSAVLPDTMPDHPPLILIHGSANSAAVWGGLAAGTRGAGMAIVCH